MTIRMTSRPTIERVLAIACALVALMTGAASAERLEINQACATGPEGCFDGDNPGFPVEITSGGSYVLTSDLEVTGANTMGLLIYGRATIDFAGHTLRGGISCDPWPSLECPSGQGTGVVSGQGILALRNGTITGFADGGVWADRAHVSSMTVRGNGLYGIQIRTGGMLRDSIIEENTIDPISEDWNPVGAADVTNGILSNVVARRNASFALAPTNGLVESSSSVENNYGVWARADALVRGVNSVENLYGLSDEFGAGAKLIVDSVFRDNASIGIALVGPSSVQSSTIRANGSYGLLSQNSAVTYYGNTISAHTTADQFSTSGPIRDLGENVCSGSICP